MDYTRRLAEFCANLSFMDLPPEVVDKTKLCILDYVANVYGSLRLSAVQKVGDYIRSLGSTGEASVFGRGFKTACPMAAFANGTAAEAIEGQDGLRFGGNHPGTAVISAAFAVGEKQTVSGRQFIEAVVAGYEAANRPAAAMHPWHTLSGFLPTGTCGTFGAAVAAAKLAGVDPNGMLNTLGNAGYVLPISMAEHLMGGHTIKIVQAGQAAQAGIMAADLATAGLTGCPKVLEGSELNGGFIQITSRGEPKPERLTERLGQNWSILDVYFKPYTACRHTHGAAQAVLELVNESGVEAGQVAHIDVHTYGIAQLAVGKAVDDKSSFVSAQFSIPYVVAACLLDKTMGPEQLSENRLRDPKLLEITKNIRVHTDEALNQAYPDKTATRVEVTLADNTVLKRQVDIPKGDPRNPMTETDIARKTRHFGEQRDQQTIDRVIDQILHFESISDIRELTAFLQVSE